MVLAPHRNAEDLQATTVEDTLNYMDKLSAGGNRPPKGMYDRFEICFSKEPRMSTPW